MNANAQRWVVALRSGKYPQGVGFLCDNDRYCVLGVACDMYAKSHPEFPVETVGEIVEYAGYARELPEQVQDWLGLRDNSGTYISLVDGGKDNLAGENDIGRTFAALANIIEANQRSLFR